MTDRTSDYVIVGAGGAGCVLAGRLTEDARAARERRACADGLPAGPVHVRGSVVAKDGSILPAVTVTVVGHPAALLSLRFEALHRELHVSYTSAVKDAA